MRELAVRGREDALDTVLPLRQPADYSPLEGARFELHVEKARPLVGEGAVPFEVAIEESKTESIQPGVREVAPGRIKPCICAKVISRAGPCVANFPVTPQARPASSVLII